MGRNTIRRDALCIGFGPAGVALSCVLEDAREQRESLGDLDLAFLEAATDCQWHRELLLDGTDINHHVFRDLVTPRNPRSRFSFAMYLKDKGRMFDFGLLGRPASRHEWSDYITWVARQVDGHTHYDTHVVEILPVCEDGELREVRVETTRGTFTTNRLVLSSGSVPNIPAQFQAMTGARVFHTSHFLSRLAAFGDQMPKRWLVVGSGQSASESVLELLTRNPQAVVHSLHRSAGFKLTQLGQYPNRVFGPDHVDYFHSLDSTSRKRFLDNSRSSNYAGIDPDESQKLFSLQYEDAIAGRQRLLTYGYHQVSAVSRVGEGYRVTLIDTFSQRQREIEVDAIVLATGYAQEKVPSLLAGLQPWLASGEDGGLSIDRDYRIETRDDCQVRLWVNGLSERSHGISDSQSFSMMALRAGRIAQGLVDQPQRQAVHVTALAQ
ncbi:SidA/IucD/PvdA family monooxygenase [Pseudomonas putida]|uniref:SidA/IucD/PvdA family monooxygenase n=1 Tax=Pseudomonas putida TaxID=303 RepID=A0A7W2QKR4_PSEPU|nr:MULTISPECIES: SidA/IucD/PvdA family monooxygenase [Pseudomonas]MBA6118046.1 SidA/IucD/PvdA family monooxygenase [Pseudomonas putida]MBI6943813.1 SidA/IucD/PvdA family monooxygenase [Pseudomonas putida]MBI6959899.1 SidA/IucD/PvdA family monooxygenase [Pseudomonas putida]MCZ9637692.1 SidA/IucD/PvdA family monooxygenase [Pseudomonas putida]MEC4876691.1 SidA/IucD/PvdA family monooxygenase [Pseudomonas sp. NC26]